MPSVAKGLTAAEAAARLASEGYNELPAAAKRTPFRIVLEVLREPMLLLLIAGGALYLVLGDVKEALILLAFALLSVAITVVQETRTERVLEALRDLTSPRALVMRDGAPLRIAGREVARGDLLLIAEGDRVPADAALIEGSDVQTDESLLTGESAPVRKRPLQADEANLPHRPGGDDLPTLFSGSLIVRGSGKAEVIATGPRSEIGRIGQSLTQLETQDPRLQQETTRLVKLFAAIGGAVSLLTILLYGLLRGGWIDAALAGIAIGMSMLPEEFPVVLAVFMAMGAWRISKARVLTRRASAIETLGSATVLCTDKTGTLTENQMSISRLWLPDGAVADLAGSQAAPEGFHNLVEVGLRASAPTPFDPMDKAFHRLAATMTGAAGLADQQATLARSYGLRPDLLAVTQVWRGTPGEAMTAAAKGAPESIALLCRLDDAARAAMTAEVNAMAADGMRVLGVARAAHVEEPLPDSPLAFQFQFIGLVGLADPIRASVPAAVAECRAAGLRVVMITGEYLATAQAIARQAGLSADVVISGDALAAMTDAALAQAARSATVFARIMPEQKLRIVTALKSDGEIVAMTGDGVNDAPSLKAADIGVAMGGRGTDVAREASSIVLLDDDFGAIVTAIRLGRRIYDNLRKSMGFIIAVHIPIAGIALLPLLLGLPIILGPVHIAFLEMVIDPVCSLVFEAEVEEEDVMSRPPRPAEAPMFSGVMIGWSVLQGLAVFGLVGGVLLFGAWSGPGGVGMPETELRALTFFSLVLSIVALILVNRSFSASIVQAMRRPNPALIWVLGLIAGILTLTLAWPVAADLFRFGPLHADDLAITACAALTTLFGLELLKLGYRRLGRDRG
jgi:Ca2+-transporting ATPase